MPSRKKKRRLATGWYETPDHRDKESAHVDKPKAKKNTRKWCKGVEGREHTLEILIPQNTAGWRGGECRIFKMWTRGGKHKLKWMCYHKEVCTTCHKVMVDHVRCPDKPKHLAEMPQYWLDK